MRRRLDVSCEAELEIFEAALRYERERTGLGLRFETQVTTIFARLLQNPFQFPEIDPGRAAGARSGFPLRHLLYRRRRSHHGARRASPASASRHVERGPLEPKACRERDYFVMVDKKDGLG